MTTLQFLTYFILLLVVAAVAINGLFLASRPHEETRPDGMVLKNGKILQGWYYFWHKEEEVPERVYFRDQQLECLIMQIKQYHKGAIEPYGKARFTVTEAFKDQILSLQNILDVCFHVNDELETTPVGNKVIHVVRAYREYPVYVFPEWLRDMMAACITCHATVYGNIAFWLATWLVKDEYAWASNPAAALIVSWVAFWLCLAYLSTWLFQRVKL